MEALGKSTNIMCSAWRCINCSRLSNSMWSAVLELNFSMPSGRSLHSHRSVSLTRRRLKGAEDFTGTRCPDTTLPGQAPLSVFEALLPLGFWARTPLSSRHAGVENLSTPRWPLPFLWPMLRSVGRQYPGASGEDADEVPGHQRTHDG